MGFNIANDPTCISPLQLARMVLAASVFTTYLLLLAVAKPIDHRTMAVHESRAAPPSGFVDSGIVPVDKLIVLRIAMKQANITGLETILYKISDPASREYGQHLTAEEVAAFVRPTDNTGAVVSEWLTENNITTKPVTPAGDMLEITIPVSQAKDLLATRFSVFTHVETGSTSIRTLQYSIPASLRVHVNFIHPTVSFTPPMGSIPQFKAIRTKPTVVEDAANVSDSVPQSCNSVITPACLQALYNIPTKPATQSSNKLGVSGFINQWANLLDLQQFLGGHRPDIASTTAFTLQTLDGGVNDQTRSRAGIEANLDTQYTIGVATGVPVTFISVGEDAPDGLDGFYDIITTLINEPDSDRPKVLTTSYGFNEDNLTPPVATVLCNAYMQLGVLGTSVIFSSGDGGVSGSQPRSCTTFIPTLPSDCPFVTSVGAVGGITEVGSSFSSGGFSNYFAIPEYQAGDVAAYLATVNTAYAGKYNTSGRGFPDVSLQGENFLIVWNGEEGTVGGTSCSAPSFASMISLLNDLLVAAGKTPLGFLNPMLYSPTGRAAFNDTTSGNNPGCGTNGFSAGTGWDPVTGLGTPDFARLMTAVGL
ncbi:family S53 protease [Mycena polygramma]|nr:family S53 protease [Mycena polygramma]